MAKPHRRILSVIALPFFTLILGWMLGQGFERQRVLDLEQRLSLMYSDTTGSGTIAGDPEREVDISLMWGVWRLLMANYLHPEKLEKQTMVYGAVKGMVASLGDPYTLFMTPKENTDFMDVLSGHLQGIGAELSLREGEVMVVNTIKGSPAEMRPFLLPLRRPSSASPVFPDAGSSP